MECLVWQAIAVDKIMHPEMPMQCPNWANEHFFFGVGTAAEFKSGAYIL